MLVTFHEDFNRDKRGTNAEWTELIDTVQDMREAFLKTPIDREEGSEDEDDDLGISLADRSCAFDGGHPLGIPSSTIHATPPIPEGGRRDVLDAVVSKLQELAKVLPTVGGQLTHMLATIDSLVSKMNENTLTIVDLTMLVWGMDHLVEEGYTDDVDAGAGSSVAVDGELG